MRLLVAEDDPALRSVLVRGLVKHGYVVDAVEDGEDALMQLGINSYGAGIIDWRLPGLEGTEVIRHARAAGNSTPILMLTAKDTTADRIEGLDAGADDYMVKPFEFGELLARVRALLRRPPVVAAPTLRLADLSLDPATRDVHAGARPVKLTQLEYAILELLMRRSPGVVSRTLLVENVWPVGEEISMNALEAHMARLRGKLTGSGVRIEAVRGVGYRAGPL